MGVNSILCKQRFRRTLFGNVATGQDNNLVCTRDGTHAVCDDEYGLILN